MEGVPRYLPLAEVLARNCRKNPPIYERAVIQYVDTVWHSDGTGVVNYEVCLSRKSPSGNDINLRVGEEGIKGFV